MKKTTNSRFILPNEEMNKNPQASYNMDTDILRGFKTAAASNQTRLSMEYLIRVIDTLVDIVSELQDKIAELEPEVKKPAATKKASATVQEVEAASTE